VIYLNLFRCLQHYLTYSCFFLSRKIKIFIFIETIKIILSVALGSQLANVFLHLLPEAFAHPHASSTYIGLWTLIGLFLFFLIEQIFPEDHHESQQKIKVCLFKFNCLV